LYFGSDNWVHSEAAILHWFERLSHTTQQLEVFTQTKHPTSGLIDVVYSEKLQNVCHHAKHGALYFFKYVIWSFYSGED
jgi:hypothetical protein